MPPTAHHPAFSQIPFPPRTAVSTTLRDLEPFRGLCRLITHTGDVVPARVHPSPTPRPPYASATTSGFLENLADLERRLALDRLLHLIEVEVTLVLEPEGHLLGAGVGSNRILVNPRQTGEGPTGFRPSGAGSGHPLHLDRRSVQRRIDRLLPGAADQEHPGRRHQYIASCHALPPWSVTDDHSILIIDIDRTLTFHPAEHTSSARQTPPCASIHYSSASSPSDLHPGS